MEREQIIKMCLESSDKAYHTFLHNEGWKYDTKEDAIAGYERQKKSSLGVARRAHLSPGRNFGQNCG